MAAVKDRTYSFRAGGELGPQVESALEFLRTSSPKDVETLTRTWLRLLFRLDANGNRSGAFRDVLETLARAWAKTVEDRAYVAEYKAWAQEDGEASAWLDAVARATAEQWRDE
jgi:hypothetical protein